MCRETQLWKQLIIARTDVLYNGEYSKEKPRKKLIISIHNVAKMLEEKQLPNGR